MVEVYGMYGGGLRDVMVEVYGIWWRFTGYTEKRLNNKAFLAMVEVYGMRSIQVRCVWWKELFLISPPYNMHPCTPRRV
jgi:hypothetical protein